MEATFSFLSGLVEAFEDVGKGNSRNKKNNCHAAGIPSCGLDVTTSAEDYSFDAADMESDSVSHFDDVERQDLHHHHANNSRSFHHHDNEDHHHRRKSRRKQRPYLQQTTAVESVPSSISEKKSRSFTEIIKSKSSDLASKLSLLQSFSGTSSHRNDAQSRNPSPPDVVKSSSSLSNTTNESTSSSERQVENDDEDFDWDTDLSLAHQNSYNSQHKNTRNEYPYNLPPPPSNPHLQWFAHGLVWTCLAIVCGWTGFGFSYAARQSTHFISVKEPLYLDPRYERIPQVGMIRLELCWNDTHLEILEDLADDDQFVKYSIFDEQELARLEADPSNGRRPDLQAFQNRDSVIVMGAEEEEDAEPICFTHRLTSDDVDDDTMYTVASSVAFLAIAFGAFTSICLTFSIFWKTINLRPIGGGFLVAYFLQSFTFLIFDSSLCKENLGCSMDQGGVYSALASVCWIVACAACARMDNRKYRKAQKEEELEEQEEKVRDFIRYQRREEKRLARLHQERQRQQQQQHPDDIVIEGNELPSNDDESMLAMEKPKSSPFTSDKPKPLSPKNRGNTAETANMTDEEDDSESLSHEKQQSLQELKELNKDPIYIPALPQSPPSSLRSVEKKSSKPNSATSTPKNKSGNVENEEVRTPKKPRSKSSKSKFNEESQPISSASLATYEEAVEKPNSSKRKKKSSKKSPQKDPKKPPSPVKSIDMAGDVIESDSKHKKAKNSPGRVSTEKNMDSLEVPSLVPEAPKKRSSSRPRKARSNSGTGSAPMRESVRKSIEEGKQYEL